MKITHPVPGPWLRELRRLAGVSQQAAAEHLGVSGSMLCKHEREPAVSPEVAGRIVAAIVSLRCRDSAFAAKLKEVK